MSGETLILVHTLIRHGEKTPDVQSLYPSDPHKSNKYYPFGYGALTNDGKQTMYSVGKAFRKRYGSFIGDLYFPELIDTRSSLYERCRTSAAVFLAGLLPPAGPQIWENGLNWQPIPINYSSDVENDFLPSVVLSKKFMQLYKKLFENGDGSELLKKHENIKVLVEKHTGWQINTTRHFLLLRDIFSSQKCLGLKLPEWSEAIYPGKLDELALYEYEMETHTKELRRIVAGPLFKNILTDSLDKINGKSACKMHIYMGHDVNIANVLITMGMMYKHFPAFGAALTWELHKIDGRYGLKIFYKKDKNLGFEPLPLSTGETIWWLDDFENFVNELWNDD